VIVVAASEMSDIFIEALFRLVEMVWPLVAVVLALGFGRLLLTLLLRLVEKRRLRRLGLQDLDTLSGVRFETYLKLIFEDLGYSAKSTPKRGDFGADLILEKDGKKTAVQAKRYAASVGIKAVQEAIGATSFYKADKAMVITNSSFTRVARALAKSGAVELVDRAALIRLAQQASSGKRQVSLVPQSAVLEAEPDLEDGVCAECGRAVSHKVRDYCLTHLERFGGRVLCWEHQRLAARSGTA
jgi:restriction system protein